MLTLQRGLYGLQFIAYFVHCSFQCAGCGAGDEDAVPYVQGGCLYLEFGHLKLTVILHATADIYLALGGQRTGLVVPFAQELALIVSIPEATIKDARELPVPFILALLREGSVQDGLDGFFVASYRRIRAPGLLS